MLTDHFKAVILTFFKSSNNFKSNVILPKIELNIYESYYYYVENINFNHIFTENIRYLSLSLFLNNLISFRKKIIINYIKYCKKPIMTV